VVKNVAGYGIHRLMCGSRGGLAVIVEASLKLATAPEARAALVYEAPADRIAEPGPWSRFPRLEPALLSVVGREAARALPIPPPRSEAAVVVGLEDDASWVERQIALTIEALGMPTIRLEGDEASALARGLADLEEQDGARLSFTTAQNTPAALAPLLGHSAAARMVFHAPAGRLHLFPETQEARALLELLTESGFSLIGMRGVADLEPLVPPMAAVERLRSRVRAALDPGRRMALGARWERGGM
jgi:FAD/FMN-containing dehydrogenase